MTVRGKNKVPTPLGRYVTYLRNGKRINIQTLADKIGSKRQRVSRLERGSAKSLNRQEIEALAAYFQVPLDTLTNPAKTLEVLRSLGEETEGSTDQLSPEMKATLKRLCSHREGKAQRVPPVPVHPPRRDTKASLTIQVSGEVIDTLLEVLQAAGRWFRGTQDQERGRTPGQTDQAAAQEAALESDQPGQDLRAIHSDGAESGDRSH